MKSILSNNMDSCLILFFFFFSRFPLVLPIKELEYNPISGLLLSAKAIHEWCLPFTYAKEFGDAKTGIMRSIIKSCNRRNAEDLKNAIALFNEKLLSIKRKGIFKDSEAKGPAASPELVAFILEQAYIRAVAPYSDSLNNYQGTLV